MALSDEKILLTGPAGQIAYPLAEYLAKDNEVWGLARFSNPDDKAKVEAVGVKAVKGDMGDGDFSELPDDFTYVIHFAALMAPGWDFDAAIRANAEGTGLLLAHTRKAKAALVMSTHSCYRPQEDPMHVFVETDPLGEVNAAHAPPYSMSKISQEAVARTCARLFDLPVTIARMNASYGRNGGLPVMQMDTLLAGDPVTTRWDPCMYSPIHQDDINAQTEALLDGIRDAFESKQGR
jgi:nucleoside-diphosphate-sugar epimerase